MNNMNDMNARLLGRVLRAVGIAAVLISMSPSGRMLAAQENAPGRRAAIAAGDSALDAQTRSLASQLRCPVCQGLSIQDSPSELSQQMRDIVRQQLAAGKSPDEVKQYFVGRYGEWILMEPPAHGFNWLVYALPALMLVLGVAVLVAVMRRWTASAVSGPTEVASGNVDGIS